MAASVREGTGADARRIEYLDGLRGLAIALVVVLHGWDFHRMTMAQVPWIWSSWDAIVHEFFEGVSLFLVLSGVCLSLPLWTRRAAGATDWFRPRVFFARRCLRILPPYWLALALTVALALARPSGWLNGQTPAPPLSPLNVLIHAVLLHNNTPYVLSLNSPFWSLGLEWQWYWLFPLVLVACMRSARWTLVSCLGLAVLWHVGLRDAGQYLDVLPVLPMRLCEFCCGVAAAGIMASRRRLSVTRLALGLLLPLLAIYVSLPMAQHIHAGPGSWILNPAGVVAAGGLKQPLYGIAWASLVLLCHQSTRLRALVSWRPLTFLGAISYSLYLIHLPVIGLVYDLAPLAVRASLLLPFDAVALAVAAGMVFHLCIERPCMAPATRSRVEPVLARWLGWTDILFERLTRSVPRAPSVPVAPPRPAPASPAAGRRDGQDRLSP